MTENENKVILSLEKFLVMRDEETKLKQKYEEIINFLFRQCELANTSKGKHTLRYDSYHGKLVDFLYQNEPEKFAERIKFLEESEEE